MINNTTADDQQSHSQTHQRITTEIHKTLRIQAETGITISAYRMKNSEVKGPARVVHPGKAKEQQSGPSRLQHQGEYHYVQNQGRESNVRTVGEGVLDDTALCERKFAGHEHYEHGGKSHYAQSATLDEYQYDPLTEKAQPATSINHHQPGNTRCRCSGKQGIHR
jgi:hypothetical protein